ncbi:Similar to ATF7IP: Activating transcription factor 7-interacting protein 1 (Gallus gallus) [Cotesia congregata]|uniref:Similar to ATF7IP: Activating transcription factor 7-interacting protein 1 (Gallus gallus) n=1 Tax=Cotesia congregata TaxID=51543 RepID=A0A8J2HMV9_COTCN|nr:Similar to ATF7IP: Activating transcription factor 7-interacting protein 1 (Gallus gallus) [Cotesia congregata]
MVVMTQKYKHPAPLPERIVYSDDEILKLPPPVPLLKVSKVSLGIVVSWNMTLDNQYADIESYQLYTYRENTKAPASSMWKKVGDICALKLPMACTLTQLSKGIKYYFAVRAVDKYSRVGPFSQPGEISL